MSSGRRCRKPLRFLQSRFAQVEKRPMFDGKELKPQHAPKAPHEDPEFLNSVPARPIRILAEYIHPLVQLKKEGIGDTIVMFGSARIEPPETSLGRLTRLKKTRAAKLPPAERNTH